MESTSAASTEDRLRAYLKRVTGDLQAATARMRELESEAREPVAIIGMGCRWPGGVSTPDELWRLIMERGDALTEFPRNRGWDIDGLHDPTPGVEGRTYVRAGGFLPDADLFDAEFFGIGPAEAEMIDPQQRLLLETCWEAVENARIDPTSLRGTDTGVFLGVAHQPYGSAAEAFPDGGADHRMTGAITSVAAGRVSYTLGLEGPSLALDAACASGPVALHMARQSLWQRDCSLALVGAATVMADAAIFLEYSRHGAMAPDGRCKSFSAVADGAGWADGVGVFVVERLSDALRHGHEVLAVVRGSAVNHDGASNGLTSPNGSSQRRMIRKALADARLSPAQVDLVEGHGTGTPLGDTIEAGALVAAYGARRERPLWLGSVKANIGHPQVAAGMAGLMKTVLALRHATLPPTRYADRPTDQVDWGDGAVRLVAEAAPWPETGRPRRAGVSAFGVSGTNVHTILEQAPPVQEPPAGADHPVPWVLSARTPRALRRQARRLLEHLTDRHTAKDVGWSLATTRTVFPVRAAVLGDTAEELRRGLAALADGRPGAVWARAARRKVVFAFPDAEVTRMADLARSWLACGVRPAAVIGHRMADDGSIPPDAFDPERWLRESAGLGDCLVVEFGPDPVVGALADTDADTDTVVVSAHRHGRVLDALAVAHTHGVEVDWRAAFAGLDARTVSLPTYAFERQAFWLGREDEVPV
ncbi:type I polyketide synthase [Streptomyces roseirectus]|uniref:type I polyketide synthase n=1 Tax=Streptomyces roseirectus TaxID=2768066 RepID=UPI001FEA729E|nr:type I polyketide synthase [Streptomyces roseirectus]